MRVAILILIYVMVLSVTAMAQNLKGQTKKYVLPAKLFAEKINKIPTAAVIDVRSAGEFEEGHLLYARNVDYNGSDFEARIRLLKKDSAVFVYCLNGKQSHAAAEKMRRWGFKQVYELEGGLLQWRAAGLPEENAGATGMTLAEFEQLINTDKKILFNFYADWCKPCKRMAPHLIKLQAQLAGSVVIISISADNNPQLDKALNVTSVPTLLLYQNGQLTWRYVGYMEEKDLANQLQAP